MADLALKIKEANIKVDCSAASIEAKIQRMEEQYQLAHDWLQNTGEGCLKHGEDVTTYVKKLCPFSYEIDAAMRDQASVQPLALSNHKDDDNSKEDTDPEKK